MNAETPFRLALLVVALAQGAVIIYYVKGSGAAPTIFLQTLGVSLLAADWFVGIAGLSKWVLLAVRTRQEEQKLMERFGSAYRE